MHLYPLLYFLAGLAAVAIAIVGIHLYETNRMKKKATKKKKILHTN